VVLPIQKGLGRFEAPFSLRDAKGQSWNLLREDLSLPAAVLYQDRLNHNLDWMRRFIAAYGVQLCPHGKTTMAPRLFQMQLEAGAWGITLATATQARVAYEHGVRRVILANQLIGRRNMEIVSELIEDPQFDFYCLVDSPENVAELARFFHARSQCVQVLLEVGIHQGRAGIRSQENLAPIIGAFSQEGVALAGVELFEGVVHDESAVDGFIRFAVTIAQELATRNLFKRHPFILTGAGSEWFDRVVEIFTAASFAQPCEVVLRPGCYLTHDVGTYRAAQARIRQENRVAPGLGPGLLPALQVWAYVQSRPEPDICIVGLGKRDAAFDSGLPVPDKWYRPHAFAPEPAPPHWSLIRIMDQHTMLRVLPEDDVRVGDMIAFDVCHPCLTFDKWRYLSVVDADYNVVEVVETFF